MLLYVRFFIVFILPRDLNVLLLIIETIGIVLSQPLRELIKSCISTFKGSSLF
jgi:hypothetical protein